MVLLFLESIGTTELLVILVVALVVFGPRRLPELGRKLGKSINEFKRASDDFKRTWEFEVELEQRKGALDAPAAGGGAGGATYGGGAGEPAGDAAGSGGAEFVGEPTHNGFAGETVARTPSTFEPDGWTGEPQGAGSWDEAAGQPAATTAATTAANAATPAANPPRREGGAEDEINAS